MRNKFINIFLIISYFILSVLFFAQSFEIIFIFDPFLILSFFGIPSDILMITFFVMFFWIVIFFILPVFGPRILKHFFPNMEVEDHEKFIDSIYQTFARNAIILFLVLLVGGITFDNLFKYPIGNFIGQKAPSWILAWFFIFNSLFELINYFLIYKKKR